MVGGLRDRMLPISDQQRRPLDTVLQATMEIVINNVFSYHGIEETPL